ncbi:unnamed protein product [Rotaria sp. Silwood2]|nr:unnamed protein product [Rotaria sp. Silwood2]
MFLRHQVFNTCLKHLTTTIQLQIYYLKDVSKASGDEVKSHIIGIALGIINSCVAIMERKSRKVLENTEGIAINLL